MVNLILFIVFGIIIIIRDMHHKLSHILNEMHMSYVTIVSCDDVTDSELFSHSFAHVLQGQVVFIILIYCPHCKSKLVFHP